MEYDRDGRLTWRFRDVNTFASNLNIYFRPIENIVIDYINNKLPSHKEINTALELYKSKNYYGAIQQIDQLLSSGQDSEISSVLSELKFLQALCYQELYQLDKALELFNQIEDNLGFGDTLSNTIRNKILYDKAMILKSLNDDEKVLDYLNEIKPTIKNNEVFLLWLDDEIKRLTPAPPEVEEVEEDQDAAENEETETSKEDRNIKIIDSIDILGYEVPIEILLGVILLVIIILFIIRSKGRKRRNRYSMFR